MTTAKKNIFVRLRGVLFHRRVIGGVLAAYLLLSVILAYLSAKLMDGIPALASFVERFPHLKVLTVNAVNMIPILLTLAAGYLTCCITWPNMSFLLNKNVTYHVQLRRLIVVTAVWTTLYTSGVGIFFLFLKTSSIQFWQLAYLLFAGIPLMAIPPVLVVGSFFAYKHLGRDRTVVKRAWFLPLAYPLVINIFLVCMYACGFIVIGKFPGSVVWFCVIPVIIFALMWYDYRRTVSVVSET